ncbi:putative AC transposase [Bienertia sinuspersici]
MEEAHNGFNIKSHIVSCCKNFHLVDKIFSILLDNAMANTKTMDFLKEDPSINMLLGCSFMHEKSNLLRYPTQWNSTYKLLLDAIAYRDVLTDLYNESRTDLCSFITNDHWSLVMIVHDVLQTFDNATNIFSYVKRYTYFKEFPYIYGIVVALDPGVKLDGLTNLLKFNYELLGISHDVAYYVNKYKTILERLCELYGVTIQPEFVGSSSKGKSRFGFLGPKNPSSNFHVLARIAKDILVIHASTIASESVFIAGRRVLDEKDCSPKY